MALALFGKALIAIKCDMNTAPLLVELFVEAPLNNFPAGSVEIINRVVDRSAYKHQDRGQGTVWFFLPDSRVELQLAVRYRNDKILAALLLSLRPALGGHVHALGVQRGLAEGLQVGQYLHDLPMAHIAE